MVMFHLSSSRSAWETALSAGVCILCLSFGCRRVAGFSTYLPAPSVLVVQVQLN